MLHRVLTLNRRSDKESRIAVMQAIDLHQSGDLMEALKLLLEKNVPTPVIVRTLLSNDQPKRMVSTGSKVESGTLCHYPG